MITEQNLLSYWHKLEHFSPAELPKDRNLRKLVEPLPWEQPLKASEINKTIEYTIYLGVFPMSKVVDFVQEFFHDSSYNPNPVNTEICYASLKLDESGVYREKSLGISTLPWALGQLKDEKITSDSWSSAFQITCSNIQSKLDVNQYYLDERFENLLSKPQSVGNLNSILDIIVEELGWNPGTDLDIYVKAAEVYKSKKKENNDSSNADLLNSFYIQDLERVIQAVQKGDVRTAMGKYMDGCLNKSFSHNDLKEHPEILKESLRPLNYPDGCWPSLFRASLMQQFAVNEVYRQMSDAKQEDLFSVNGPPGTGKTTLLRDIIAFIMVRRAKIFSTYSDPSKAFSKIGQANINDNYTPFIYRPDGPICDTGIVVASSNNGAVENISKELPLNKEIEPYTNDVGYFRTVAEECMSKSYWGIISATLGNKENRRILSDTVWLNWENKEATTLSVYLQQHKVTEEVWKSARQDFQEKLEAVTEEKRRLEGIVDEYQAFGVLQRELVDLQLTMETLEISLSDWKNNQAEVDSESLLLEKQVHNALQQLQLIQQTRPGFWTRLFNRKLRQKYEEALEKSLSEYTGLKEKNQNIQEKLARIQSQIKQKQSEKATLDDLLSIKRQRVSVLERNVKLAKQELGTAYADNDFWENLETKSSQETCPWYSEDLKKLQSELFIAAMYLNEVFILRANTQSSRIKTTLDAFFHYLKGDSNLKEEEIQAVWQTFWLVMPVISTTFASAGRMFADLGTGSIPWLFIDEAGQAVPQAAAGTIWRAHRVVAVGDPFQIEPVVTIPEMIMNHLSDYFKLDPSQVHPALSVQVMADRVNKYGWESNGSWIGAPLRVHRRCLDPMFTIANDIAYQGMMYNSTAAKEPKIKMQTSFLHVCGEVCGRHFVAEQGAAVLKLLLEDVRESGTLPDIFVISPFSEIPNILKRSVLFKPLQAALNLYNEEGKELLNNWLSTHIGTVHTFQGKQASGVILCLGLDKQCQGAASWAASKPNLLNVALTRAKHRFIAIGDQDIWLKQNFFSELKELN